MNTISQKVENSTTLNKLLNYKKILDANGKDFALQIKRASLYFEASENYKLQETKDEFKRLNIEFKDKYHYFLECFGTAKMQSSKLIKIGKADSEKIAEYLKSTDKPNITALYDFLNDKNENNTTTEGITEKTETEKPAKFSTTKKGIDIKINSGVTDEDFNEAIAYLQSLQK